ncbi:MAG: CHASE2 domain-containing protein, partial [Campylobacterota bacterium]|nr:CHASE2 domain-containing protein [Campylobacterota bacterium]
MKKRTLYQFLAAGTLGMLLSLGYLFLPQSIYSLDDRLRDFLFILRGEIPQNSHVVIIDIDEKSLAQHGRWPWPRHKIAKLIDTITTYKPGIIGVDIIFAEADNASPHYIANDLNLSSASLPNYDLILANSLKKAPILGGYLFLFESSLASVSPMISSVIIQRGGLSDDFIPNPEGVLLNIPILQEAYYSSGFLNNIADSDGVVRSVPLLMNYKDQNYLSLSIEMLRIYYNTSKVEIYNTDAGVNSIVMGDKSIPTDRFGKLHVNFRGASKHFTYISAADVLENKISIDQLKGKFVLLGTSAIGLGDVHATPFDSSMSGVEIHANIIDNILEDDFIYASIDDLTYNILIILLTVFTSLALFSFLHRKYMPIAFFAMLMGMYYFFSIMLFSQGIILTLLFPFIAFILSVVVALLLGYIFEAEKVIEKEQELSDTNDLMFAQSKSAAMGEMVGMIAHQWRQPLSSMSAISSKVKLQSQLGKLNKVEESMDEVVDLTQYLSQTIDDFRNYLKPNQELETVSIDEIVDSSLRFTSHLIMTKNITIEKKIEPHEVTINKNELMQVIINLIKNAIDAYEGKSIETPTIRFTSTLDNKNLVLSISDHAGGIDEEKLPYIFEEYYSTKGDAGTGLGLYMSRKIVEEKHHGSLNACNENGGLCFRL